MKSFLVVFLMLISFCGLRSQERDMFFELGGSGGLGSFNYEWWNRVSRISYYGSKPIPKTRHVLRAGLGLSPIDKNNGWVLVFPVMYQLVYGEYRQPHRLEIGAEFAPSVTTKGAFFIKSPLSLGYRYWNWQKRFFFRVTYTPIVAWLVDFQWQHWGGITIGYRIGELL